MRITMIGGGYVGLVSGACFADLGVEVVVVESDADKLALLHQGRMPIYEPGLERLVTENVAAGRLRFTADLAEGVRDAEVVMIAVGTPTRRGDGHADVTYVNAAAEQVARALTGYAVIVTKSTVPVGTGRRIAEIMQLARPDLDFDVASNPEFLREGSAIGDFMRPDRVVIGCESERAREVLRRLYRPLYLIEAPILFTGIETAELTKYAANSFLAMKVTFINEMADLCEKVGADVHDVARGIGLDGPDRAKFLHPGPGYGGSCFPKDTLALVRIAQDWGRAVAAGGGDGGGQRRAQGGHSGAGDRGLRRVGAGQGDRGAGADLQAGNRRHARCAEHPHHQPPGGRRGGGTRVRSGGRRGGAPAAAGGRGVWHGPPADGRGRRCAGAGHRMERVPRFGADAAGGGDAGRVIVDLRNVFDPAAIRAAGFEYRSVGRP